MGSGQAHPFGRSRQMIDVMETMKPCLQYGKACRPTKGEDRVFTLELAGGRALLVGVADGLSSANGGVAAEWIEQTMHDIAIAASQEIFSARELFQRVADALTGAEHAPEARDSLSTLSCGICELKYEGDAPVLHFDFFGVGDSPIWRVAPLAPPGELKFQANVVYDSPTPREQGLVYSFVNLLDRKIEGRPHFGSVELAEDELLVVASDGVPEWRIFGEDQDPKHNGDSPRLIDRLFEAPSITDALLKETLLEYDRRGMLIDDDASIAVVRWRYPREVPSESEEERVAEPAREDVRSAVAPEPIVSAAPAHAAAPAASSTGQTKGPAAQTRDVQRKQNPRPRNRSTSARNTRKGRGRPDRK
jgi:hypothetical protein